MGTETRRMSGGRFIAETFSLYGVTHVFYVEAILRSALVEMERLGIKRVLTHSEKAAAYMADGYARISRKPGVCMAQSVGAANLAAGLQDPYLGLSPVIALTGRKPFISQYRNAYQEILHHRMFEPVTKYNVSVDVLEQLPYLLRQSFREATSGAPGPVHLDFQGYEGEIISRSKAEMDVIVEDTFTHYPSFRPEPELDRLREVVELLKCSKRPVIVAGGGARASSAGPEIVRFAEMCSIPVAASLNGKEVILETHALCIGVVGSYSRWCANRIVAEADLVIFIGSRTGDQVTNNWTIPGHGTTVIQIDINPVELGRNYPNTIGVMGDAKVTVSKLNEILTSQPIPFNNKWAKYAEQLVKEWRRDIDYNWNSNTRPIKVERLCKEISKALPHNAIIVADTGYAAIWTGTMVYLSHDEQSYIRAAGSLGWAYPASLGAKCAAPTRPVVCFTGDGGFFYHMNEVETASRLGLNTVTIVNNNRCLRQCLEGINLAYGNKPGNRSEMYRFRDINFARIAQEMGGLGIRVEDPQEISGAIRDGLGANKPCIIDVVTDENSKPAEAWKPRQTG